MNVESIIQNFKKEGFVIIPNKKTGLDSEVISDLNNYVDGLEVKRYIPFSKIPWGWGSLLDKGPFKQITDNEVLNSFCKKLFNSDNYVFPNMMINNKARWIGPDVEWHREIFNIDTYAPGYSPIHDWKKLFRVYIPLDKQTKENGCLEIYKKSHEIESLDYDDMIDSNFGHKRRVNADGMKLVHDSCEHLYCEMEAGDMLIFNDKIVHGSTSNKTSKDRKSIVLGARHDVKEFNQDIYDNATSFRQQFIETNLQKIIDKLKGSDLYSDFNKGIG